MRDGDCVAAACPAAVRRQHLNGRERDASGASGLVAPERPHNGMLRYLYSGLQNGVTGNWPDQDREAGLCPVSENRTHRAQNWLDLWDQQRGTYRTYFQ
jgi:hypothetical protein